MSVHAFVLKNSKIIVLLELRVTITFEEKKMWYRFTAGA